MESYSNTNLSDEKPVSSNIARNQDVTKSHRIEDIHTTVEIIFSEGFNNTTENETINSLMNNNGLIGKFKLVYDLIAIQFLIHSFVYVIVNIILKYNISSLFKTLPTSESVKS